MKKLLYLLAAGLAAAAIWYGYGWYKAEPENREPLPALLSLSSSFVMLVIAARFDHSAAKGSRKGLFRFNRAVIKGDDNTVRQGTKRGSSVDINTSNIDGSKNDVEQG